MINNTAKTSFEDLLIKLPRVFDEEMLATEIKKLEVSDSTKARLQRSAKLIPIKWNMKPFRQLYGYGDKYEPIELLSAWATKNSYLSHYSALYWNELIDQRPIEHFLSTEVRTHSNSKKQPLNQSLMKLAFMKGPRTTQHFGSFQGHRYFFVEKADVKRIGVANKKIPFQKRSIDLRITDVERTLIDAIIAPHYAGGMLTVIKAFSKAQFDIKILYKYYKALELLYPYWQTIGFVIEKVKGVEVSEKWRRLHGSPSIDFYFDRNAREDWQHSERWRLYFPKGIAA